ncbi:Ig-like domain-containing protein [Clostridium sp. VAP41]|uniref:Ig-like domain-containing protein n=1 Tax=Clostridium sp. VAP41 TaxID=2949979 RepID=UPI00207A192F|nr:Ig-like domain-containing protein [Clostridium sp. VAP41]
MNKQFKKIIIMFVMVLTIMSIGIIQNGTIANAATVGEELLQPEDGWTRYDDRNGKITYIGNWTRGSSGNCYNSTYTYCYHENAEKNITYCTLKFYGTKLRVMSETSCLSSNGIKIDIDGKIESYNQHTAFGQNKRIALLYEKTGLENKIHEVKIYADETTSKSPSSKDYNYSIDAIDIDENGYLLGIDEEIKNQSISLDKSSLSLKEGNSKILKATTTPASVDVVWSSSDETIATVDQKGKVIGVKEGTCTVIAKIDGTDLTADCLVTVTKEDIVEPEEPSIENGSLYIEMIDGNIKRADKSQIEKFKKWFISRDLDETESPIFKITNAKGNIEYLVHDKVIGFEIRE